METAAFPWLESETATTETVALKNVFLHKAPKARTKPAAKAAPPTVTLADNE